MAYVVVGVPGSAEEVREWESMQYGMQRRLGFRVTHPDLETGKWQEIFEAANEMIPAMQDAIKAGVPIKMEVVTEPRLSGKGKPYAIHRVRRVLK